MVKHIPPGQDFQFPKDFGFSGSAGPQHSVSGPSGPKPYAKGGAHKPTKAVVAVVTPHGPPEPAHDPQNAIRAAAAIGALAGAKAARSGQMGSPRFAEGGESDEDGHEYEKGGRFIQGMHLKKGALHRELGVPEDQPIPESKLRAAASGKYGPKAEKRAHTAEMLKGLPRHHGPRKG